MRNEQSIVGALVVDGLLSAVVMMTVVEGGGVVD